MSYPQDYFDDDDDGDDDAYCDRCNNTGWIDCHCGGDLCVCENNGEKPCPKCKQDSP